MTSGATASDVFTADSAFDVVDEWIALVDTDYTIRRANPAMAAAFGLEPADLVGRRCHEVVHGSGEPVKGCPHVRMVADSGAAAEGRIEIEGHGPFRVRCSPLRDATGALAGSVHVARSVAVEERETVARESYEAVLRRARDDLFRALKTGRMGSWEWDIAGRSVTWSDEIYRMWGVDRDFPLTPESVETLLHPGDRATLDLRRSQLLAQGGSADTTFRIIRPDGEERHILLAAEVELDAGGAPARAIGVMQDVTEAVETREALRGREALLRGLVDTMPSGCAIFTVRGEGRTGDDFFYKEVNAAAAAHLGLSKAEIPDRSFADLHPDADHSELLETLWRVWRTGDAERHVLQRVGGDGQELAFETSVFRLPTGEVVAVYHDASAARRAERALRSSEAEMQATFDLAGIPMLVMDTRGAFMRWNRAARQALGYSGEDLARMTIRDITPPEARAGMLRRLAAALEGEGVAYRVETQFVALDGERRWFDASVTPVRGPDGAVVALIGAATDVTDAHIAKQALIQSEEQLREALGETIEAMGAIVALRDPYTAGHERRVAALAEAIALDLGLAPDVVAGLRSAALVHDVGKVVVPAEIMVVPRRLSEWEFSLVKTHVEVGHEVLAGIAFDQPVALTVLHHHERLDGSGYPNGLRGDEISVGGRILAVADVVEAMATHRPYRPALGVGAALDEIGWGAGRLYDERVVASCRRVVRRGIVDLNDPGI